MCNNCNNNCGCNSLFSLLFGSSCHCCPNRRGCGCNCCNSCGHNRNRCGCNNYNSNRNGCGCNFCHSCGARIFRNASDSFSVINNVSESCDHCSGCGCYDAYYAQQYGLCNTNCGCSACSKSCGCSCKSCGCND